MNMEYPKVNKITTIPTMKTVDRPGPKLSGGYHIKIATSAAMMAPTAIHGRRRPQRERVLSDRWPMIGSKTKSSKRGILLARPMILGSNPIALT